MWSQTPPGVADLGCAVIWSCRCAEEAVVAAVTSAGRLSDTNHQSRPGHGSSRSQRQRQAASNGPDSNGA